MHLQQRKIAVLPLEVIRNHSKSGLLGSEFRLPFGELLGGDFAGLFRINLREPSFERLGKLGRLLRRRVDGRDELAADPFRLETELLVDPEDELQGLARRGRGNVDKRFGRNAKRRCDSFHLIFPRRPVSEFVVPYRRIRQTALLRKIALGKTPGPPARADAA